MDSPELAGRRSWADPLHQVNFKRHVEREKEKGQPELMPDVPGIHLKTFLLIAMIVVFAPLGNVLLGKGMKSVGPATNWTPSDLGNILLRILSSGYVWLGVASLLTFFVAYMLVLTWADYSYVQPASSFSYAMVALLGYLLLGEVISPLRWFGIAVICFGVLIVGHTEPRTTVVKA
jgi:uncharacterized membrane protein